ncbi:putative kinesin light chain [Rhizoctonia solani 123E]|uniref:Putative kinesin light chain n=1 Tax=Rhizoctonia solani 123E TaxID=1423351 RepID=A0A074RSV8_9AGAM|nr:putative kinesin light chain [Rhizoctonia solani 123E]
MHETQEVLPGLNILSIDGGAVGGLTSLVVLEEAMHRLQGLQNSDKLSIPANQFDLIAGTGTGGISACMLGRLEMPIDKAIDEYRKLMKVVFAEKKLVGPTTYKKTKLQRALRSMIREATGNEEEPMLRREIDGSKCKTAVFAMAKNNLRACLPVLFRSYRAVANPSPDCAIWEALQATMAHPDLFKSIEIDSSLGQQSFVGGELGCSNPIGHVLSEAKKLYPDRHVACILSIGAGHARIIQVLDPKRLQKITRTRDVEAAMQMATDSERLANEMAIRFNNISGVYFRFNVDQEIQSMPPGSSGRLDEVAHARAYLRMSEVTEAMEQAVQSISERRATIATEFIDGQIPRQAKKRHPELKRCPALTPVYTGCVAESNQVESCITSYGDNQRVCVICGLGGVGKTQLALNVIQRTRDKWDHIIYLDASSSEVIENALRDFAITKGVGETYGDALTWMEYCPKRWLLVFDNADDRSVKLGQYIPGGHRGSIIITTRLTELTVQAKGPGSTCRLSGMRPEDALALLIKTARLEDRALANGEMEAATALLQDFGYLALAIVHAGAYIGRIQSISITQYRGLFLSSRQRILERSGEFQGTIDGYGKTVYTTWRMNYELLKKESQLMLWLIAFLHYDNINEAFFKRAASNMWLNEDVVPPTKIEQAARYHVRQYLGTFIDSAGQWDGMKFKDVMADLASCSLIDFDHVNLAYSVHVLVQEWASTVITQSPGLALECTTTLISMSIDFNSLADPDANSFSLERQLGAHINSIMRHKYHVEVNHAHKFANVCFQMGQWNHAKSLEERVLETYRRLFGDEHLATLGSIYNLISIYISLGLCEEAEKIGVKALDTYKQLLGEEHISTLRMMGALSLVHAELGQIATTERLQSQILDAYKTRLGEEHPATLKIRSYLMATYSRLGQWIRAEQLGAQVLTSCQRALGEDHPETLAAMGNLAAINLELGRWDAAQNMQVQVLDKCKKMLGEEHPHTLHAMSNNASIYSFCGQWVEAEKLQSHVLAVRKRVLGEEHPHTLLSMNNLASIYSRLREQDKAEQLLSHVLNIHERLLGKDHPVTLTSMSNLAAAHTSLGRWREAVEIGTEILTARERVLGIEHPDTLETMAILGLGFSLGGALDLAKPLQLGVMDARKRLLGEEHPDTIKIMSDLAFTYAKLGQITDAKSLLATAITVSERSLGNQHPNTKSYRANMTYIKIVGYLNNGRLRSLVGSGTVMFGFSAITCVCFVLLRFVSHWLYYTFYWGRDFVLM